MKKCVAFILVFIMLFSNFCYAMPTLMRNETVYINLDNNGDVKEINIYNKCINNGESRILDYTNYEAVTNLTNKNEYKSEDEKLIWDISGEKVFSYTGKVSGEYYDLIPWNFNISYKLNGVYTLPESLLGGNGLIEIIIDINANEKANEYYKNNYMLEITGSYDMSDYLSIDSDEAMITDTGNTKTLMFIVLPGQSTTLHIEIGSENFKMDGITMAIVPITGEILNQVSDLADEKQNIEDAMEAINKSTDIVLNSLAGMNSGLNGISSGVSEIKKGTSEIHGLGNLRDEDISNLKQILEDMLPIIENVQTDLDNMDSTYKTFIDMSETLNIEIKNLEVNVNLLNENLGYIEKMMKNFPKDVSELSDTFKILSKLTGNINTLLQDIENSQTSSTDELKNELTKIGVETKKIEGIIKETLSAVQDEETFQALLGIGDSASEIGKSLTNVQKVLNDMSSSTLGETSTISKNLKDLKTNLNKVSNMLDDDDAETLKDTVSNLKDISETLEDMLDTVSVYNDKFLSDSGDFIVATDNMRSAIKELKQMDVLSLSMISNIQNMLNILSNELYNGVDKTADALLSVNNQLLAITKESTEFMNSKNTIKDIVENKWDEASEKTNIFNIDKDAKAVSFGSEKNENINQVQFVLKTPDIKEVKIKTAHLEDNQKNMTFWDRILMVLNKMFGWIIDIFN